MIGLLALAWGAPPCRGSKILDPAGHQLFVRGKLGRRRVRVMVDTGGMIGGSVHPRWVEGEEPTGVLHFKGMDGVVQEAPLYRIEGLELGGQVLPPFEARLAEHSGRDLTVGVLPLLDKVIDVDVPHRRFCVLDAPAADLEWRATHVDEGMQFMAPVRIGDRAYAHFLIDTGAGMNILNIGEQASVAHRIRSSVNSVDATGTIGSHTLIEVDQLCTSGRCQARVPLMLARDLSEYHTVQTSGILGYPYLRQQRFALDYRAHRIGFEHVPAPD